MYDITALGELLIDFTPCGMSEAGMKIFEQNPGGAPANVLAAAGNFGAKTAFIGKVGKDMHGEFLKETLKKYNIETKGLIMDEKVFTTLAFVSLNEKGERTFSFARKPGADTCLTKEEVNLELIKECKIFHFGSLSLTDNPSKEALLYALEKAKEMNKIISYDPNYRPLLWENRDIAVKEMRDVVKYADIMKISDEETELLTGCKEPEKAASKLIEQGVSLVFVTLGSEGSFLKTKDFQIRVKSKKCNVVDTTGAGDAFWGAILYKLAERENSVFQISEKEGAEYLEFANIAAGICVEKRGAIPAMPSLEDVLLKNIL
ncbi:carbohydrate kinase [Fusobacterium sp. SB021]|uniref:carbohydrate kinase family protein n=1 Tax=Fusobacterium sp. SB021 TaxID=2744227 RepID=UPI003CE9546A